MSFSRKELWRHYHGSTSWLKLFVFLFVCVRACVSAAPFANHFYVFILVNKTWKFAWWSFKIPNNNMTQQFLSSFSRSLATSGSTLSKPKVLSASEWCRRSSPSLNLRLVVVSPSTRSHKRATVVVCARELYAVGMPTADTAMQHCGFSPVMPHARALLYACVCGARAYPLPCPLQRS